jgi:hypothetical protein
MGVLIIGCDSADNVLVKTTSGQIICIVQFCLSVLYNDTDVIAALWW